MQVFHTHSTEKTYSIEKISTKWLVLSWEKFAFCTNNAVKIYYFFVWNHNLINSIVNGTIVHFQCFHIVTALRIVNSFFFSSFSSVKNCMRWVHAQVRECFVFQIVHVILLFDAASFCMRSIEFQIIQMILKYIRKFNKLFINHKH